MPHWYVSQKNGAPLHAAILHPQILDLYVEAHNAKETMHYAAPHREFETRLRNILFRYRYQIGTDLVSPINRLTSLPPQGSHF